jgi:hypothetical protein
VHYRAPHIVGAALLAVLVCDAAAVAHLGARDADRPVCAAEQAALPPLTTLEVDVRVLSPVLRAGDGAAVRAVAVVTNRGSSPVVVAGVGAVLVAPATTRPLTWTGGRPAPPVELPPGTFAELPMVLHLRSCPDARDRLAPGFYETVVVLRVTEPRGETSAYLRRSPGQAVVLSP